MYTLRFYLLTKTFKSGAKAIGFDVRWSKTLAADPNSDSRLRGGAGISCHPDNWWKEKERPRSREADYAAKVRILDDLRARIKAIIEQHEVDRRILTPKAFLAELRGKQEVPEAPTARTVAQVCADFCAFYASSLAPRTLGTAHSMLRQLERWRPNCPIGVFVMDPRTKRCDALNEFCAFLAHHAPVRYQNRFGLDNNTIHAYIKALRGLMRFEGMPIDWFKNQWQYVTDGTPLEYHEVERLLTVPLPDHEARVRDLFVFACLTGPRYQSLTSLTPSSVIEENGIRLLEYAQRKGKAGEKVKVALDPLAIEIWDRYKGLLPSVSVSTINNTIKKVAQLAGLTRPVLIVSERGRQRFDEEKPLWSVLSCHTARHTFATLLIDGGADLLVVQKALGHGSIYSTQRYAQARANQRHAATLNALQRARAGSPASGSPGSPDSSDIGEHPRTNTAA